MMHRTTITVNPNHVRRSKTAMQTTMTPADHYRIGIAWYAGSDFVPGRRVEEVNHFGRRRIVVGGIIRLRTVERQIVAKVLVLDIMMRETRDFTAKDLDELGYSSHDEYIAECGKVIEGGVWFMHIQHLDTLQAG